MYNPRYPMSSSLIIILGVLIISYVATILIRHLAIKRSIIDIPNERSSHEIPTPRGGGLAFVLVTYIGLSIWKILLNQIPDQLYFAILAGIPLILIGILDDIYNVSPIIRIICQILVVSAGIYILGNLGSFHFLTFEIHSNLFIYLIIILGLTWFINLFNFLDGIDGYASMEAMFLIAVFYYFTRDLYLIMVIAAILGFAIWNFPFKKAKIFMGDVGSTFLGYIIGILAIYFHSTNQIHIRLSFILALLFIFDATVTLLLRIKQRERISTPHRKHIYQRFVQAGYSHLSMLIIGIIINSLLFALVLFTYNGFLSYWITLILSIFCVVSFMYFVERKIPFRDNS